MCVGPFKPKMPKMPDPPAPPPSSAASPLSNSDIDFNAVDTTSGQLKKKKRGKGMFKVPLQNNVNVSGLGGTGLNIPKGGS
jgi:hypothetical protein